MGGRRGRGRERLRYREERLALLLCGLLSAIIYARVWIITARRWPLGNYGVAGVKGQTR
jgi:hypothetical protein